MSDQQESFVPIRTLPCRHDACVSRHQRDQLRYRCHVCGSQPGDPCVIGEHGPGEQRERTTPHEFRGKRP